MKFSITLDDKEREDVFGKNPSREFDLIINGRKFACEFHAYQTEMSSGWYSSSRCEMTISGYGTDKKAQELTQAKAEVNRPKEAHKEAQRKLSALMEEDNVK